MTDFPPATRTAWLQRVEAALKGAAFDPDQALHGRVNGPGAARGSHGPWRIFMAMDSATPARAAAQAQDDIDHGADGLVLATPHSVAAITGLPLHRVALRNDAGTDGAQALADAIGRLPVDPARMAIDFGVADAALATQLHARGFAGPFLRGDGRAFHNAGVDDAGELGAALAQAIAHLRSLDGWADDARARAVSMTLVATQNMFTTLAKMRAARLLWRRVLSACALPDVPLALHAETSRLMMAEVDAHSNILRTVAACFGAGLGGADSISVLPFSTAQGVPNSFARRVARNLQYMLLHESGLWRVDDPAHGAGSIEQETARLCAGAWAVMQQAERGTWPTGDAAASPVNPRIGVTHYKPPKDFAPEIEAAS